RIKPQKGIYYFVSGSGGQLRPGDLRKSPLTEVGYDAEQTFMLNEIAGDELYFQVISRTGRTVDAGVLPRQPKPKPAETPRYRRHPRGVSSDRLQKNTFSAIFAVSAVSAYRAEKRTRMPTLKSRGVPVVDGLVWTKYVLSSMFCMPKNAWM